MGVDKMARNSSARYLLFIALVLSVASSVLFLNHFKKKPVSFNPALSCGNPPLDPALNYWPLTFKSAMCSDGPLIDGRNPSADRQSREWHYADSQAEHDEGIRSGIGDSIRISLYFDNGAADNESLLTRTTARNTRVGSAYSTEPIILHRVRGILEADNSSSVSSASDHQGGDLLIKTASPSVLDYVPGSTKLCLQYKAAGERGWTEANSENCGMDASGRPRLMHTIPDGVSNGFVTIGDLKPGFDYSGFVVFMVRLTAPR